MLQVISDRCHPGPGLGFDAHNSLVLPLLDTWRVEVFNRGEYIKLRIFRACHSGKGIFFLILLAWDTGDGEMLEAKE